MSSSRLSQREKKQEKYRRHVASLASTAKKEDSEEADEVFNPIKPKIRYVADSSDEPKDEASEDYKKRFANKYPGTARTGRSLTRSSGSDSRSSSVSSNGTEEPGKIVPKTRTGRSLTRSTSEKHRTTLPTRRSLSANKDHSRESSLTRAATHKMRERSRSRARSTSRDPKPESTDNHNNNKESEISNLRPLSSRSPFAKLLAEKKSNIGNLKRKPVDKSKYDVKAIKKAAEEKRAAEEAAAAAAKLVEDAKPSEVEEPALVNEAGDRPQDEEEPFDAVNVSALIEENLDKHTKENGEEEFADPELEELESEVTVNTELAEAYMASNSILAKLATSPVHEVASPVSDIQTKAAALSTLAENEESTDVNQQEEQEKQGTNELIEEKKEESSNDEITDAMVEEKKEAEDVPAALKAWDLANPEFANFTPSQDEEFSQVDWGEPPTGNQFTGSAFPKTEDDKAETDNEPTEAPIAEEAPEPSPSPAKSKTTTESVDMFDTSSWAAGTVTDFSNMDIEADKNFVKMMTEEMKFRSLTEDEQKLLLEANQKIIQAEEKAKEELNKAGNDKEPLIAKRSDSVEGSETNTAVSMEDRLKMYATNEPDSESEDSTDASDGESSGDDTDMAVEYVGQENEDDEPVVGETEGTEEAPINLVSSGDVPTLDVAASAASAQEIPGIPKTLSEFKRSGAPPPPPPPGMPKRKKKKKKKKSKSSGDRTKIPLLAPPSEEKLRNWKGGQQTPQDYVAAMAERLADTDTKTLDESSEYFHFKSVEKKESAEDKGTEKTAVADNDDANEDDSVAAFAKKVQLENEKVVMQNAEKNNLWKKEVDDAMGLVERLEEQYDKDAFPELAMFPSPLSDDEIVKKPSIPAGDDDNQESNSEKQEALTVDVESSPQESLFASPKAAKADGVNEKITTSSSTEAILTDSKMADKFAKASSAAANTFERTFSPRNSSEVPKEYETLAWFTNTVLKKQFTAEASKVDVSTAANLLLEDKDNFNAMCRFIADRVNEVSMEIKPSLRTAGSFDTAQLMSRSLSAVSTAMSTTSSGDSDDQPSSEQKRTLLRPVILSEASIKLSGKYLAANFVSFLFMASKLARVPSPFGDSNPFLAMIVDSSLETISGQSSVKTTPQELIFEQLGGKVEMIFDFVYEVTNACDDEMALLKNKTDESILDNDLPPTIGHIDLGKRFIVPESHPSPFEESTAAAPRIVAAVLSFLGDPVAICTMKKVNQTCRRIVSENEHTLMQDAVRSGGLDSKHRPAFWMYVALEKSDASARRFKFSGTEELYKLELSGEEGKWHHVIQRDVERSFGNMPPHKTSATMRSDSIVAALVTWGQSRLMKRGVKGGGEPFPIPEIGELKEKVKRQVTNISSPPWSEERKENSFEENDVTNTSATFDDIALCGNSLSDDEKADLQKKLGFILHTLAASYEDIGYCQGMDYVVAHLLRYLQDTIRSKAANMRLPAIISTSSSLNVTEDIELLNKEIDSSRVVEETIVRMVDTFFGNYNLKHMYWPELRCLKTCCRVFERLIQIKLPVLADHFEHHDLNIGLFALGWFQTLFLYLPSMPSATVNHIWDIWLVERSFKIFFRVGTAILFLSQPILLNHELEGMMTYLNTIPDATLLRPDILIPCALNIKVTNRLLQELEDEVMKSPN